MLLNVFDPKSELYTYMYSVYARIRSRIYIKLKLSSVVIKIAMIM